MAKPTWTADDIPSQAGRVALVTGANSGIGYDTARLLARAGATVVLGCRNPERASAALARLGEAVPGADASVLPLDLADLASVAACAEAFSARHDRLDLLIDNAGIMMVPRGQTADGFERQLGTNHLGHFALTGRLLPLLVSTPGSRVVVVSSLAHKGGKIDLEDLMSERRYGKIQAYCQSKLANLLFVHELQRRLDAAGHGTIAAGAHPGWTSTNLQADTLLRFLNPVFAMDPVDGALPSLYAATADDVRGDDYFGPSGVGEIRGAPARAKRTRRSKDDALSARLWEVSEALTGVRYDFAAGAPATRAVA